MTRVLLADDEPALSRRLERLLDQHWDQELLGPLELDTPVSDGPAALAALLDDAPEVAFLDIRMPGCSGIDVARQLLAHRQANPTYQAPQIVFVTAYDDHALEAFEAAAVDYLLKPVEPGRLRQCLERLAAQQVSRTAADSSADAQLNQLAKMLEQLQPAQTSNRLRWLRIGRGDEVELVPVDDVVYFRSEHKYTTAVTAEREHLLRRALKDLLPDLDPDQFWQIHRGIVVNVGDISKAERDLRGRYELSLRRRPEKLRSSLSFSHQFKQM